MVQIRRKRKPERRGRRPILTDQQKKQVRRIAQKEIELALRRMLGSIGIHYGKRPP